MDSQYQYQGDNFWFTLRGSLIHEFQKLRCELQSIFSRLASNPTNELNEARAYASLAYGNDNRSRADRPVLQHLGHSRCSVVYAASAFSPNTNGWIAEIAYIPFISSTAPGWPWFNARIGLQYTWYEKFDGTSVGAQQQQYAVRLSVAGDVANQNAESCDENNTARRRRVFAADRSLHLAPILAVPPVMSCAVPPFTWTSCYGGLHAGGGLGTKDVTDTAGVLVANNGIHAVKSRHQWLHGWRTNRLRLPIRVELGGRHRRRSVGRKYRRQNHLRAAAGFPVTPQPSRKRRIS